MEKELLGLFETAEKAADAAATSSVDAVDQETRCLDALKQLHGFPVNVNLLVSTQVGKRLRKLTKHPRKKIQTVASDLIEMWKGVVLEEQKKSEENEGLVTRDSIKSESLKDGNGHKISSVKVEKASKVEPVKIQKIAQNCSPRAPKVMRSEIGMDQRKVEKSNPLRSVKADGINNEERQTSGMKKPLPSPAKLTSMTKCDDSLRDKVRELLHEALSKVSGEASEDLREEVDVADPVRVAVAVETALFQKWGRSNGVHKVKYRSLMFNIKDPNNPDFRRKVLLGHVEPKRLPNMSAEEMASDQRQRENEKIKEKALLECQLGGEVEATTDQFKCGRCGQRRCTYYQMQTRSADEPMTTYVTCVNCNNRWKFC